MEMKELNKFQKIALMCLSALISLSFLYVYYHICHDSYDFTMVLRTLLTVAVSFGVYVIFTKCNGFLEKHYKKIVAVFLGAMLVLQVIFVIIWKSHPSGILKIFTKGLSPGWKPGPFPIPATIFSIFLTI